MGGFRCGARGTLANKAWPLCATCVGRASRGKGETPENITTPWHTWQVLHCAQSAWVAGSVDGLPWEASVVAVSASWQGNDASSECKEKVPPALSAYGLKAINSVAFNGLATIVIAIASPSQARTGSKAIMRAMRRKRMSE